MILFTIYKESPENMNTSYLCILLKNGWKYGTQGVLQLLFSGNQNAHHVFALFPSLQHLEQCLADKYFSIL